MLFKSGNILLKLSKGDLTVIEVVEKMKWRYNVEHLDGRQLLQGHDLYCPSWWSGERVAIELLGWLTEAPDDMRKELGWDFSADEIREWGYYNYRYEEYRSVERVFLVSETFEVITPDSAANGDAEDRGFVFQDEFMTREELVNHIQDCGFNHPSEGDVSYLEGHEEEIKGHPWLTTADPVFRDYKTGAETYKSLFVSAITGNEYWELLKEAGVLD